MMAFQPHSLYIQGGELGPGYVPNMGAPAGPNPHSQPQTTLDENLRAELEQARHYVLQLASIVKKSKYHKLKCREVLEASEAALNNLQRVSCFSTPLSDCV